MSDVDCVACLATKLSLPNGHVDDEGITHYVRWNTGGRLGCFKLCDYERLDKVDDVQLNKRAIRLDLKRVFGLEDEGSCP